MFDLQGLIKAAGYLGLFAIIFSESGLLIGIFFPGDSLLFTAGFLASQGYFDIALLTLFVFVAAVLGDSVGYAFGFRLGPRIFTREDSLIFHKDHLERAQKFYERHGGKTIVLARFMPVLRTFAPILAGVGKMRYRTFLAYNIVGGALWAIGFSLAGYFLGTAIPDADHYVLPIIAVIIFSSFIPPLYHIVRNPEERARYRGILRLWMRRIFKIKRNTPL